MARSFGLALRVWHCALCATALCLSSLMIWASPALAFDERDEGAVIGSFRVGHDADSDPASDEPGFLYDHAVQDLRAGRTGLAQKQFERLIAREPDSALAMKAREQLAGIYGAEFGPRSEAHPAAVPAASNSPEPRTSWTEGRPAPARDNPPAPPAAWVSPDLEMNFIETAGDRVFFGAASAELGGRARTAIERQAYWLLQNPSINPVIEGYADDRPLSGDQSYALAEARAMAVKQRLIEAGVPENRLSIAVYGEEYRIAQCPNAVCAAQNRRVVTALVPSAVRRSAATGSSELPRDTFATKPVRAVVK